MECGVSAVQEVYMKCGVSAVQKVYIISLKQRCTGIAGLSDPTMTGFFNGMWGVCSTRSVHGICCVSSTRNIVDVCTTCGMSAVHMTCGVSASMGNVHGIQYS